MKPFFVARKKIKIIDYFMIFLEIRLERLLLQYKKLKSGFIDSRNVDVMFPKKEKTVKPVFTYVAHSRFGCCHFFRVHILLLINSMSFPYLAQLPIVILVRGLVRCCT